MFNYLLDCPNENFCSVLSTLQRCPSQTTSSSYRRCKASSFNFLRSPYGVCLTVLIGLRLMDFVIAPRVVGQHDKDDQSEGVCRVYEDSGRCPWPSNQDVQLCLISLRESNPVGFVWRQSTVIDRVKFLTRS